MLWFPLWWVMLSNPIALDLFQLAEYPKLGFCLFAPTTHPSIYFTASVCDARSHVFVTQIIPSLSHFHTREEPGTHLHCHVRSMPYLAFLAAKFFPLTKTVATGHTTRARRSVCFVRTHPTTRWGWSSFPRMHPSSSWCDCLLGRLFQFP